MFALMTLSEIYRKYLHELQTIYSKEEAAQITSLAFESIAGLHRSDVIKEPTMLLPEASLDKLLDALTRLLNHEPIQHITGEAWFCKLKFSVSPAVLVPRPETEELVCMVSAYIKEKTLSVLDIGTGSGCIAISLKNKHPQSKVSAVDISEEALHIAARNSATHDCDVHFIQSNFLDESSWAGFGKIDVVISNPPYIPVTDRDLLDKNVTRFEPHLALFEPAGEPFIFYEKIALFGCSHLHPGGRIYVEIHEDFGKEVLQIFQAAGYQSSLQKDIFGRERFVVASRD